MSLCVLLNFFKLQKYTNFFYFVGISIRKFCHTFAAVIFSDNIYKIFLVEDDNALALAIEKTLSEYGNEIKTVTDFRNVTEEFLQYQPQLVLLDIKLPYYNGFHWCGEIRKISKVPIVFLSSASSTSYFAFDSSKVIQSAL